MSPKPHALRIERWFDAPRDVVFRAWIEREQLSQWYHFNDDWKIAEVEVDARVGGKFRIGWKAPDGKMWYELGEYREILPPERLVHTCRFEFPDFDEDETLLTVEFREQVGGTLLILVQEGYRHAEHRDNHQQGWPGFLDQLVKHLKR
jgi:uncharacterized protein YndB with AHSA1/START domain